MEKPRFTTLGISFLLLAASTIGGSLIAAKLGGYNAGKLAFTMKSICATVIFLLQLTLFALIRNRLFFLIVFLAASSMTLFWFLFCLFTPILWSPLVQTSAKIIIVLILVFLCGANLSKGLFDFRHHWFAADDPLRHGNLDPAHGTISWERVQRSLKYEGDIYIPGLPRNATKIASIILVAFMIIGLNLRTIFPLFSAFAWGIPSAVLCSYIFQDLGCKFSEAAMVRKIQTELKIDLKAE